MADEKKTEKIYSFPKDKDSVEAIRSIVDRMFDLKEPYTRFARYIASLNEAQKNDALCYLFTRFMPLLKDKSAEDCFFEELEQYVREEGLSCTTTAPR